MQMNTIQLDIDKYEIMLKELGVLKTENDELKNRLSKLEDLLCIIHRDGGHYITEHGLQKAFEDALEIHYRQRDVDI